MINNFKKTSGLERAQGKVILQAIEEGFVMDDTITIDANYFEARDQVPSKAEHEEWLKENRGSIRFNAYLTLSRSSQRSLIGN